MILYAEYTKIWILGNKEKREEDLDLGGIGEHESYSILVRMWRGNRADYPVQVIQNVEIPMSDGVRLGATLYVPHAPNDGPFPAIVESLPYRKDDNKIPRDWRTQSYLARKGYVGVRLDVRGTGASEGIAWNEYTTQEQQDCLQVLAWVAAQPWCTGNLGMWGSSYGGSPRSRRPCLLPRN
jgi:predicted acyl esterase